METVLKPGTAANRIAKILSIILAVGVLGYLVYCAHDAAKDSPKKTYLPTSKSGNPTPFKPTPRKLNKGELVPKDNKKKTDAKKKDADKKRVFIHTSKSGNFHILKKKKKDDNKK